MDNKFPLIMLVDDDHDFVEINRHFLENAGYRTCCAYSPAEAMQKIASEKPDLIITDLMMDALDSGFVFSRELKRNPDCRHIPVIIVTAVISRRGFDFVPRSERELAEMSADAFFSKPVPYEKLIETVRALLSPRAVEDKP